MKVTNKSYGQDTLVIRELDRLESKINASFNFTDNLFKKTARELYLVTLRCENNVVKDIELGEHDAGVLKHFLLINLKKELIGYKFNVKTPKQIVAPILFVNPFAKSSVDKSFTIL